MRAVVVLPTPRTPVRIQACGMRPDSNALEMVRTMASWPIRSAKVDGRYLRARTRYGAVGAASFMLRSPDGAKRNPGMGARALWIVPAFRCAPCGLLDGGGRLTSDPNRAR